MNQFVKIISTFFLLVISFSVFAEPTAKKDAEIVKKIIEQFMTENQIQGVAVDLYVNGKPQTYYFGYANPATKKIVTKNTIFELGSISKVMTSILLAQQVDAAVLQLNKPIKDYLTYLPDHLNDATLKNLATHTTGLALLLPETIKTQPELENYIKTFSSDYIVNQKWIYSNVGMGLLGKVLENATHKDINTLYQQNLLLPLHMQPIGMHVPADLKKHYAQGFGTDGKPAPAMVPGILPAGGQVKASAKDMMQFLSAAIGLPGTPERIIYPMRLTQSMYVKLPNAQFQGLGWVIHSLDEQHIATLLEAPDAEGTNALGPQDVSDMLTSPTYNGDMLIDKTGMTDGFRSYIAVIPNKKTGIVILANKRLPGAPIARAGREILFKLNML